MDREQLLRIENLQIMMEERLKRLEELLALELKLLEKTDLPSVKGK